MKAATNTWSRIPQMIRRGSSRSGSDSWIWPMSGALASFSVSGTSRTNASVPRRDQ